MVLVVSVVLVIGLLRLFRLFKDLGICGLELFMLLTCLGFGVHGFVF